jgi:hypothetical protein
MAGRGCIVRSGDALVNALLLMLILADGAAFPGTWKGRISDLKCGAMVDTACNRRCIEEGQQAVLVEDETGEIRPITNTDFVKKYAGAHVEVKGTSKDGQINVRDVKPLDK